MNIGGREQLHKHVPLVAPYLVQIFPCYSCNFKCGYCVHALPRENHGFISDVTFMDFELYKRTIDDMSSAGWRLKMLRFAGMGEPLLHSRIAEMVDYAVKNDIAEKVDIVTNASLLTPELSDKLIAAGLSTLRISLEGLSDDEYRTNCGTHIDFGRIKRNIAYYFEHSGVSKVYVKIIDYMLKGDKDREREFFNVFEPISHVTNIEHLIPVVEGIDFYEMAKNVDLSQTQDGNSVKRVNVCSWPFFMLQVNPDGKLTSCCSTQYPGIFGEVADSGGIVAAWTGEKLREFWRRMLMSGAKGASKVCSKCELYQYSMFEEDILDGYEDAVLRRL